MSVQNAIQALLDEKPADFQKVVHEILSQNIEKEINELRKEVSPSIFGEEVEPDEDDDLDLDDLDDDEWDEIFDDDEEELDEATFDLSQVAKAHDMTSGAMKNLKNHLTKKGLKISEDKLSGDGNEILKGLKSFDKQMFGGMKVSDLNEAAQDKWEIVGKKGFQHKMKDGSLLKVNKDKVLGSVVAQSGFAAMRKFSKQKGIDSKILTSYIEARKA